MNANKPNQKRDSTELTPFAFVGLGVQFVVALLVFVYAGSWADGRLGTSPLFLLLGLLVGGGGTFFLGIRRTLGRGGRRE